MILAVFLLVRSLVGLLGNAEYKSMDKTLAKTFFWALNIQLILGVALYAGISPLAQNAFSDMGSAMSNSAVRFFIAEHFVMALLAIGAGHFGISRAGKASEDKKKHLFMLIGTGLCLVLMMALIPWPGLPYGRAPFFLP